MSDATAEEPSGGENTSATTATSDGESITDLAQQPVVKEWATFLVTLFALVGVGIGLLMILGDAVGEQLFEVDVDDDLGGAFGGGSVEIDTSGMTMGMPPHQAMFWAIPASVLVGALASWRLPTDDTSAMLAAAIGTGGGTLVLVVVGAFLSSFAMDDLSVDVGGALINGIVAGLVAAAVAAAAAWVVRNRAPTVEHGGPTLE